jgi:hypothetical protein
MKESYMEDLANHFGLELYADGGNVKGVATTEVYAGKLLNSEITHTECRHCVCPSRTLGEVWAVLGSDRLAHQACCELGHKARVRFCGTSAFRLMDSIDSSSTISFTTDSRGGVWVQPSTCLNPETPRLASACLRFTASNLRKLPLRPCFNDYLTSNSSA